MARVGPDQRRARSFDDTAAAYEYGRPGYPKEAIDWWGSRGAFEAGRTVLDLAAGTGKLTRQLIERPVELIAVEPLPRMRAQFAAVLPGVEVRDGTAEAIPLESGSVDTVLVAQAFHWFDMVAAVDEIARVLRPGGGLGMIWNDDDVSVAWVAEFSERKNRVRGDVSEFVDSLADATDRRFDRLTHLELRSRYTTTRERLVANALSRSYISVMKPADRDVALAPIRDLLDTVPEPIEFPQTTTVTWCRLR